MITVKKRNQETNTATTVINNYYNGGGSGGEGSTVTWEQLVTTGNQIAKITIDGNETTVFAPSGGSGGGISSITMDGDVLGTVTYSSGEANIVTSIDSRALEEFTDTITVEGDVNATYDDTTNTFTTSISDEVMEIIEEAGIEIYNVSQSDTYNTILNALNYNKTAIYSDSGRLYYYFGKSTDNSLIFSSPDNSGVSWYKVSTSNVWSRGYVSYGSGTVDLSDYIGACNISLDGDDDTFTVTDQNGNTVQFYEGNLEVNYEALAKESWVDNQGYITQSALTNYVTSSNSLNPPSNVKVLVGFSGTTKNIDKITNVGSANNPVYVDEDGVVTACNPKQHYNLYQFFQINSQGTLLDESTTGYDWDELMSNLDNCTLYCLYNGDEKFEGNYINNVQIGRGYDNSYNSITLSYEYLDHADLYKRLITVYKDVNGDWRSGFIKDTYLG